MEIGVVGSERAAAFTAKEEALEATRALMQALTATPREMEGHGLKVNRDGARRTALDLFGYPDVTFARLTEIWPELASVRADVAEQLEIDGRYAGYLQRQMTDVAAFRKDEALSLPGDLDYASVGGLSAEIRAKLSEGRPATLGAAARIPGVTPAALTALLGHVKKQRRGSAA